MVHCCHCDSDTRLTLFGDPLWIRVKRGEELREIKKRIQATLEIPDEEFKQWRFVHHTRQKPLEYLMDDDEVVSRFPAGLSRVSRDKKYLGHGESFIALQH